MRSLENGAPEQTVPDFSYEIDIFMLGKQIDLYFKMLLEQTW